MENIQTAEMPATEPMSIDELMKLIETKPDAVLTEDEGEPKAEDEIVLN